MLLMPVSAMLVPLVMIVIASAIIIMPVLILAFHPFPMAHQVAVIGALNQLLLQSLKAPTLPLSISQILIPTKIASLAPRWVVGT